MRSQPSTTRWSKTNPMAAAALGLAADPLLISGDDLAGCLGILAAGRIGTST
jgi:hypothetical protein